jgi:hypothetical protein
MNIELTYDKGLLRAIDGVAITYGPREWTDKAPCALGSWAGCAPLSECRFR